MLQRNILIFAVMLFAGCATTLESVYVPGDSSGWKMGFGSDRRGQTIAEYVPANESINNWSKLLTIQFLEGERRSPPIVMEDLKRSMQTRCPGSFWNIIQQDSASVLYEWKIADCANNADQHELARLLKGNDGVHRIAYTEKTKAISSVVRDKWINALTGAYVVKGSKKVALTP